MAEIDASISDLMTNARLYTSGVGIEFNPNRMILNKVIDVWCMPAIGEDSYEELDDKKLYLFGASLKDLGLKCFAFTELDPSAIPELKRRV